MVGGGGEDGGGRALRRVDSSPRPTLCRSDDSVRKKKKGRSKRSRITAALRELGTAAKAASKDKDGLLQLLVTGHRRGRGGSVTGDAAAAAGTPGDRGLADDPRRASRAGGSCELDRPGGGGGTTSGATGRRRCASWAALVLALVCVVALGKAPAICFCTFAAWWCGGAERSSSVSRRTGAGHGGAALLG